MGSSSRRPRCPDRSLIVQYGPGSCWRAGSVSDRRKPLRSLTLPARPNPQPCETTHADRQAALGGPRRRPHQRTPLARLPQVRPRRAAGHRQPLRGAGAGRRRRRRHPRGARQLPGAARRPDGRRRLRAAADRGKHVLCEKPLTPTAAEARDLVAHCAARGVRLLDGFMWPHHPRTARIRALIDQGDIGEVRRVNGAFTFRLAPNPANIRYQADKAGGSLLDVGCYPVYAIRWAFGAEPARAFAVARYQFDVDAELAAVLTFADGRTASFDCGFTQPYRGWLEIVGSEALIQVPMMWLPPPDAPFIVRRDGREPETITVPGHDQIVCMLDGFSRAVLRGEPVRPSPEEAVRTLAVLDAVAASARQGRAVDVAG